MKKEDEKKVIERQTVKLVGTVKSSTWKAFRRACLESETKKTLGDIFDELALTIPTIAKWNPESSQYEGAKK